MNISIFTFIIIYTVHAKSVNHVEVNTKLGKICGRIENIYGKQLNVFLGVPYAQPPVGDLRFKKPIPAEPWKDTINAFNWPNVCIQEMFSEKELINKNMSEDCLFLNIFAPKTNISLPVLVWIHSGGFVFGTSGIITTIPTVLSARGNFITVMINHRVGTLGFVYTETDAAPGNVGIYDQIMGLQWIKDNIESFGGDPNRVTIFGASSGSMSVTIHLLSPLSRHLFNNAIMSSGSLLTLTYVDDSTRVYRSWVRAVKSVGCGNGINFTDDTIECLKKLSFDDLIKIPRYNEEESLSGGFSPAAYGNELIPKSPLLMLNEGNYKKGVSLLFGNVLNEGSTYLLYAAQNTFNSTCGYTYSEVIQQMKIINKLKSKNPININEIEKVYFNGINHNDCYGLWREIGVAIGDAIMTCPDYKFSKLFHNRNRVYQYYLTKMPKNYVSDLHPCKEWGGICHAYNILYWFGNPFIYPDQFTDDERRLSEISMDVLTHFIYHGTPPPQNGIEWQNYFTINDEVIAPYYEFPSDEKSDGYFGTSLKHVECDILWDQFI